MSAARRILRKLRMTDREMEEIQTGPLPMPVNAERSEWLSCIILMFIR
jgi:hypothetical protein